MFFSTTRKFKDSPRTKVMPTKNTEAIVKRQNAREEALRTSRSLMKIDEVPNSIPAMKPSLRAVLLLLLGELNAMFTIDKLLKFWKPNTFKLNLTLLVPSFI